VYCLRVYLAVREITNACKISEGLEGKVPLEGKGVGRRIVLKWMFRE
jgi:hypothetical protein